MLQGQDPMQGKQSSDIAQITKNAALFNAIRKKPNEISEETRRKKVEKCLNEGANISAQDKNDHDNTVLHISIKNNYQEIVKFLLEKGAKINIPNSESKSPLALAEEHGDQNLIKILTKSINVPPDSNCLFWAVALAYLIPVKDDNNLFPDRFKKLFGQERLQDLSQVQVLVQSYNPFVRHENIINNKILNELVTQQFRKKVVEHMRSCASNFKHSVEGESGLTFEEYLNKMNVSGAWGGEPEITAMSQILACTIKVHSSPSSSTYGTGTNQIELYHEGLIADTSASRISSPNRNHYNFGVEAKIIDDYQRPIPSNDTGQKQATFDISSMFQSLLIKRKAEDSESVTKKSKLDEPQSNSTVDTTSILGKRKLSPSDNDIPSIKNSDTFASEPREYSSLVGLKSSLHGTIYQLKLLILFLQRGLDKEYSFRLATEMDTAEKFDDLVFQYAKKDDAGAKVKDSHGNIVYIYRFLQAKHKQDENKQITYNDLSTEDTGGEFSLPKYFTSYRKIKQKPEFNKNELKDFILCTNINFDFVKLKEEGIEAKEVPEPDDFLEMKNIGKTAIRYKLTLNDQHELYEKLKGTSELHILAKALVEHIKDKKQINLTSPIFKSYHTALVQEKVIVIEEKEKGKKDYIGKFHEKFINYNLQNPNDPNNDPGLSESAKKLRKILQEHLDKIKGLSVDKDTELKLSSAFGKGFELDSDPHLTRVEEFVQELVPLIKGAKAGEEVTVERQKQIIKDHIDMLAGYVLVEKDKKVQFSLAFLDVNSNLPGNLGDFRKKFIEKLKKEKIDFNTLCQYQFKITNFFTCAEGQLHLKPKLPEDYIDNKEIADFFDKLVFAVNQPNEVELSEIIKGEIGTACNLIDSDFFADHIQKEMLDWFKEKGEKSKEGRFFSNKDGEELFRSTKQKIAKLILVSSTLEYHAKMAKFNIEFTADIINELQLHSFLTTKNHTQIFNIVTEYNMLSAIKLSQVLQGITEYKKDDSYIFIRLNSLLRMQDHVIQAFKSKTSNLLIIECKEDKSIIKTEIQEIYSQLSNIINLKANSNKKIVLIAKQDNALSDFFKNDPKLTNKYQETTDNTNSFTDLTVTSQKKLLEEGKIILQGCEISLNDLIDEKSKELIDAETLVKLINNDEVTIGRPLISLGEIRDYYIDRFFRYIEMKQEIRKDAAEFSDVIVISNNKDEFNRLCEQHPQSNVHWLRSKSIKLIWQESQGSISKLIKYRKENKDYNYDGKETGLREDELVNYDNWRKIVIISDTAGMGKSTVLTNLSTQIKNKFPNLWVVRIDLNDYTMMLKKESEKRKLKQPSFNNIDGAVNFLLELLESQKWSKLKTDLEKKLFHSSFKKQDKIALLFDGFDEISPNYKDIVIDLLQALKKSHIQRLFVTTRPHMKEVLEENLGVLSYTLEQFSKEEQTEFLTKFWKEALGLNDLNQEGKDRLFEYAKTLINKLSESITDREKEFTGIPLQMRMVAEVFQKTEASEEWEGCKEFLSSINESPKLPQKLDLLDLYKKFIDKKCDIYKNEKGTGNSGNISTDSAYIYILNDALEYHKQLAVQMLFSKEQVNFLQNLQQIPNQNIEKEILKIGIVTQITDNKPHFIHRTFAEYFAADFLASTLAKNEQDKKVQEFLLTDILIKPDYKIIRAFLDSWLGERKLSIPESTLTQYGKVLVRLWSPDTRQSLQNDDGNTLLHLASMEDNTQIIHFLLNSLNEHGETLKDLINAEDGVGDTALYKVVEKGNMEIIELLVQKGANVEATDKYGDTVLVRAVTGCFRSEVIELLVQKNANVNVTDKSSYTLLYKAAEMGNLEVVQCLVEKGANIRAQDNYGITVLHNAIHSNNLKVVQYLVQKGADVNAADENGNTVLHYAAYSGNLQLCKWLVKSKVDGGGGANVNAKAKDDSTVLHEAAISSNLELCKWLVTQGLDIVAKDKKNRTALHEAAKYGNLEVVQWLVKKGANVNAQDKNSNTLLHEAAKYGNSELCEWLITQGLDIATKDKKDRTALHKAAKYGNLEVVQWLVKKGANVNAQDKDGNTVLLEVTKYNKDETEVVKKWHLEKNSEVHYTTRRDGIRRIATVISNSDDEQIVQYLITSGADV